MRQLELLEQRTVRREFAKPSVLQVG